MTDDLNVKMSAIRDRTVLCIANLPKKLTSRRNLLAHFSKFGEVEDMTVKKELRSGMIKFVNHFGAQSAKTQGKEFEGKPLNIFWSDSSSLDPRSKESQGFIEDENEELWLDDDKECFGVEPSSNIKVRKNTATNMIKQHLKLPLVKKKLGTRASDNKKEALATPRLSSKSVKAIPKTLVSLKKSLMTHGNTRKLERKGKDARSDSNKLKQDQLLKSAYSLTDLTDIKHKLKQLDDRDKIIRQGTIQNSNIRTAVAIKGTCPDMCPERERILRQVGHAVATYEMIPGTYDMDENKAVKEYIRSSADQEVPLPHDLRPIPVLSMTMNYLITNIIPKVDKPDENKAVWYSFCWNRLRSIRKDIILQQLCDIETVTIVEQCARFHISCYDHMWGAEVSGFDDKINTQNLIDCLQTLKHMYEDLSKHNIICPNEPEFYSYLILLKLMTGDVMWEYQQYSIEIQLSSHVQFAVQTYMAFKNNMYSKYFNLVKRASYLTACLMQRYFEQVRIQALKTMSRAYSLPGKTVGLSSSFLVESLKFDSHKNAVCFCEREEIDVKVDCEISEQTNYVLCSSFLIRNKRLPIANAVVGESNPLPVHSIHQVTSSFDDSGVLKDPLNLEFGDEILSVEKGGSCYSDQEMNKGDPIYSDGHEKSAKIEVPEPIAQQPSFKFSLSPEIKENAHEKGLLFSGTSFNKPLTASLRLDNNEGPLFPEKPQKTTYDLQHIAMDEGMEEDMKCDKDNTNSSYANILNYTPLFSSNIVTAKSDENILSQNYSIPPFAPLKKGSPNKEADSNFSCSTPSSCFSKQDKEILNSSGQHCFISSSKNLFDSNQDCFTDQNTVWNVKSLSFGDNRNTPIIYKPSVMLNDNSNNILSKTFLQDPQPLFPLTTLEQALEENHLFKENEKRKQLENVLKQAEAERQRIEELKMLEIQKQKQRLEEQKKIEEKKMIQKLRKDVSVRMKAYYVRKYGPKYLNIWKEKVRLLKQSRDFPMLVSLSVKSHLEKWGSIKPVPNYKILDIARGKNNSYQVMSQLLQSGVTKSSKYITAEVAENLAKSVSGKMSKSIIRPIYWKLALSVPWAERASHELSVFNKLIRRWCMQSFYKSERNAIGSVETIMTSLQIPVNISIHLFDEMYISTKDLQGIDAIILIVLEQVESDMTCLERLHSLLSGHINSKPVSLAVMNPCGRDVSNAVESELQYLQEHSVISHWSVIKWENPDSIMQSLTFLTDNFSVTSQVYASSLEDLIKHVCEELFDALSCGQHSFNGLNEAVRNPNSIIQIYNTCMMELDSLLRNRQLRKNYNIAQEFKMHVPLNESGGPELLCGNQSNDAYEYLISKKINSLKLPELSNWPVKSANRLIKVLKTYCMQVHDIAVFPQIIRMIDLPDDIDVKNHIQNCSWLNIVEIWAQCNIRHTFPVHKKRKPFFVLFNKNDVQSLVRFQWWPSCLK